MVNNQTLKDDLLEKIDKQTELLFNTPTSCIEIHRPAVQHSCRINKELCGQTINGIRYYCDEHWKTYQEIQGPLDRLMEEYVLLEG